MHDQSAWENLIGVCEGRLSSVLYIYTHAYIFVQDQGAWENKLGGAKGDVYLLRRGDEKVALTKHGFAYMGGRIFMHTYMYVDFVRGDDKVALKVHICTHTCIYIYIYIYIYVCE